MTARCAVIERRRVRSLIVTRPGSLPRFVAQPADQDRIFFALPSTVHAGEGGTSGATDYFQIPAVRVVEVGTQATA
jgi:hypothetical protein